MSEQTSIAALAGATAHRLRLLQAGMADDDASQRSAAMAREVRDALARIVPEQRRPFLHLLSDQFPTFTDQNLPAGQPATPPEPPDPLSLTDQLTTLAPGLPATLRESIIDRLRRAGFPAGGAAGLPEQEQQELARLLQLPAGKKVDAARASQLLSLLVELALKLDQAVWASWAHIEPSSDLRRTVTLQRAVGRFLTGEASRQQVQQETDRLLKLGASLIVSLQKIGPGLFHNYFEPYSPSTIRDQVPDGSLFKAKEVRCWEKYEELARKLDGPSFTAALHAAVARVVRDYLPPAGPATGLPPGAAASAGAATGAAATTSGPPADGPA